MTRRPVRAGVAGVLVAVALLAAGCAGDDPSAAPSSQASGPRPLSADEADTLAAVRLNNYRREVVPFTIEVPLDTSDVTLTGRVDTRQHLAIAGGTSTPTTGDAPTTYATFAWNLAVLAITDTAAAPTQEQLALAAKLPERAWQVTDLTTSTEPLYQVARVLLNLALDRPDNAQLLRQNGAEFRGTTTVDGKAVTIMSATPADQGQTLTYYVEPETATLVRVDVNIGGSRPATITFLDGDESTVGAVPVIKALGPLPDDQPSSDTPG